MWEAPVRKQRTNSLAPACLAPLSSFSAQLFVHRCTAKCFPVDETWRLDHASSSPNRLQCFPAQGMVAAWLVLRAALS